MTTTAEDQIRAEHLEGHNSLSNALAAAEKIHMLLPHGVVLANWRVSPGHAIGQLINFPQDDAFRLSLLMWLSQLPGWSWRQSDARQYAGTEVSYIEIAAVTEVDSVLVEIWTHITVDVMPASIESGAAA